MVWLLIRTILYAVLAVTSILTFILSAAFVGKTEADFDGYYEASVELLVTGILAMITLPVLHFLFHRRGSTSIIGSLMVELAVVFVLWALFLGGAAAMADQLPGLSSSYCTGTLCSLGRAVEAFAWISWVCLTFLFIGLLTFGILGHTRGNGAVWTGPFTTDVGAGSAKAGTTTAAAPGTTAAPAPARPVEMSAV
ncbi:hypothetical protein JCM6882_005579 [Rhodosporidiobolus microsporus]